MAAKPFESWIQDLVYNVDVGIGVRLTKVVVYLLVIMAIAVLYQASEFKGLKDQEAMDYAQLGRNLALGEGFTTQYIRPASVWYLSTHRSDQNPMLDRHPDIVHPPVYAAVLAAAFKLSSADFLMEGPPGVFPPESWIILPVNHLFNLLTGLMVFLLGRRLFETRVAILAASAYFLSNTVWEYSVSGSSISVTSFFVSCALYFAARVAVGEEEDGPSLGRRLGPVLLALLFCVLAFLTRYATAVLVPGIALFIALSIRPKGWVWAGSFLLVFLLLVSPWLVRNYNVSGGVLGLAPYAALSDTGMFEGDTFERSLHPELKTPDVLRTLQAKWFNNTKDFYHDQVRVVGDGLFVCFFLTALFYRFVRNDTHLFRWCVVLAMALLLVVAGYFGEETVKLLHAFLPIILVYGAAFFFVLLDRLQFQIRVLDLLLIGIIVALTALPLAITLLPPRAGVPYPPYFPPYIKHVSQLLAPEELLCSDMPWATAWYGQRSTLQVPVTLDEFYEVNDYQKRISGLYFTTITRDKPYIRTLATGSYRTWFPILQGQTPQDFPLMHGFPINNLDQLFLTDRIRWGQ